MLHYLDDFLVIGAPTTRECKQALETALGLCRRLGIPISVHKTEGPSVVLILLGVELDTQKMEVWLPRENLRRLKRDQEVGRSPVMLQKGAAILSGPAATCMLCGEARAVLSPENDRSVHHGEKNALMIRLNHGFRSDLRWWATFLPTWNGVGMMSGVIPAEVAGMSLGPSVLCTDMGIPSLLHNPSAVSTLLYL